MFWQFIVGYTPMLSVLLVTTVFVESGSELVNYCVQDGSSPYVDLQNDVSAAFRTLYTNGARSSSVDVYNYRLSVHLVDHRCVEINISAGDCSEKGDGNKKVGPLIFTQRPEIELKRYREQPGFVRWHLTDLYREDICSQPQNFRKFTITEHAKALDRKHRFATLKFCKPKEDNGSTRVHMTDHSNGGQKPIYFNQPPASSINATSIVNINSDVLEAGLAYVPRVTEIEQHDALNCVEIQLPCDVNSSLEFGIHVLYFTGEIETLTWQPSTKALCGIFVKNDDSGVTNATEKDEYEWTLHPIPITVISVICLMTLFLFLICRSVYHRRNLQNKCLGPLNEENI